MTDGALAEVTGTLTACGDAWVLTDPELVPGQGLDPLAGEPLLLDLGDAGWFAQPAAADLDGDGTVETNGGEVGGLAGQQVTLGVLADTLASGEDGTPAAYVMTVGGLAYRLGPTAP